MRRILPILCLLGCGGGGTATPDAATPDADVLFDGAPSPDAAWPALTGDILSRLQQVPGMVVVERTDLVPAGLLGHRFFLLTYTQPVDHTQVDGPTFTQRLTLLHRSDDAPVVVYGSGYDLPAAPTPARAEPTRLLEANQIAIEHRFFTPSRPDPADWSYLNIRQSAGDYHRVIKQGKRLYPGARFIVTGGSKGGETAVFHRRFYPDDVDGTVAYVAPLVIGAPDPRFITYLEQIGPEDCRTKLAAFQRQALSSDGWRAELIAMMEDLAPGFTYDHLGIQCALEHALLELPFALWQYSSVTACADIPVDAATAADAFAFIDDHSTWHNFSDQDLARFGPYYHQAAVELGYPAIKESHLVSPEPSLLMCPGTDIAPTYVPDGISATFVPGAMPDIEAWVEAEGSELMFIYGSNDPWSAGKYTINPANDNFLFVQEAGNHGARISLLPTTERDNATAILKRWAGVVAKRAPVSIDEPDWVEPRRPR